MSGDIFTFYNTEPTTPFIIPLTLIHDARPKYKTIVIKIGAANSASSLGPITTYTYTIRNAPYTTALAGLSISNGKISFAITNLTDYATNHVLRCNDLASPNWETSHGFTGVSGQLNWSEPFSNGWDRVFYRTISE
jgi:hypothetical protein